MNSSQGSHVTLSRSSSQQIPHRHIRTPEDEIITRINYYRSRVSALGQKISNLMVNKANIRDNTIEFKELKTAVNFQNEENIKKMLGYLGSLAEVKMTVSDFQYSSFLNNTFAKNFGPYIEFHQGLLGKDPELDEKLSKLIPSRSYQGIYIRGIEVGQYESVLTYLALKEFLMLSHGIMNDDFVVIETSESENPQQISFFNPIYNTIVAYVSEKKDSIYILYGVDTHELMNATSVDNMANKTGTDFRKKTANTNGELRKTAPAKYDQIRATKPDITIDIVRRFVGILDEDEDGKISKQDVFNLIKKKSLAISDEKVDEMFGDIFERRCVKTENQRTMPIDDNEIYHSIRYKQRKSTDGRATVQVPPDYRDDWLILFNVVGLTLPKHALPALKPKPILANTETSNLTFKPRLNKTPEADIRIHDLPEPINLTPFNPEAGILIQNTMNVQEMYLDDKNKKSEPKTDIFPRIVNQKFADLGKHSEFKTVEFQTKSYFQEALRLSQNPHEYIHEKTNPIQKFLPVNYNTIYAKAQTQSQKYTEKSKVPSTSQDLDEESMQPNFDARKVTLEEDAKNIPSLRFKQALISPIRASGRPNDVTTNLEYNKNNPLYGSTRHLSLSTSTKVGKEVTRGIDGKQLFRSTFKIPDKTTLKAELAKKDPITDPYSNPTPNNFRNTTTEGLRDPFFLSWKQEIGGSLAENKEWDYRPRETLEKEVQKKREEQLKHLGIKKNSQPWVSYYKLATKERGMVDQKLPSFNDKGSYVDGVFRDIAFVRGDVEYEVPFELFHRQLRKTDKNQYLGEQLN